MDNYDQGLRRVDALLADLADEERQLIEAIENINLDLGNDAEEFMATTGQPKEAFYRWRRKAKAASLHKQRRLRKVAELKKDANANRTQLLMLSYADKAGYRGKEPLKLLDALYLLLLDVLERSGLELDEQETGLVMAVRLQCGYGIPGEKVSGGS